MSSQEISAVSSYNEWDPLEEVVVGVIEGAAVPAWDAALEATLPGEQRAFFDDGGRPFPSEMIDAARRDLDGFVALLEREGITVRRPDPVDFTRPFATPDWRSPGGLYAAMPRDLLLVVGDEIIETPMAWRSRYFEVAAFRRLLKEYFAAGARWTSAPKPELRDDLYQPDVASAAAADGRFVSVITEDEPTFDAADFCRCGRDLFVQESHVTNRFGIEWLRRHLGDDYRIHQVEIDDLHPMHIDATLVPLAPGKLLVNPEKISRVPDLFKDWEVRQAPLPAHRDRGPLLMCSCWVSMNVLSLDPERVLVESAEKELQALLKDWGLEPIPCDFQGFNPFGGSFHCATLDVRRRGRLESYF